MSIALIATLGLAAPALATGAVMPPTIPDTETNRSFYQMWFGPAPADWVPRGEVIVDSGLRAAPNGFPFPNYGSSFEGYNLFFPMPTTPVTPISSATMRSLYGDGVCMSTPAGNGNCQLTPAAEYLAEAIFQQAAGGHCYGFSATSAAIFNGQLSPEVVGGVTLANQAVLTSQTQQVLARNWATQFTVPSPELTPAQVVEVLQEALAPGVVPVTLTISGDGDGHSITPYALFDRGNGLIDIGVYDNNYPGQERAVHVDMNANTWEYLVTTRPGVPETIWSGDAQTMSMTVADVAEILAVQPCIICDGGSRNNLVTVDPTPSAAGELLFGLADIEGQNLPADRYNELPPLTPLASTQTAYPAYDVNPGDGFVVVILGQELTQRVPVIVRDHSTRSSKVASDRTLAPGFATAEVILDTAGLLAFGASVPSKPRLDHAFSEGVRHYTVSVYGGTQVAANNLRTMELKRSAERVVLGDDARAGGAMTVTVTLSRGDSERRFRAQLASYPAGGDLVLDYGKFKRTNQRPSFGVDTDGDGTIDVPIRMKRVR
jgi:hypothetical protein